MPDEPRPDATQDTDSQYDAYLAERQQLIEGELSAQRDYDKWLITLSGGALGLSLTFLKDVVPLDKACWLWTTVAAWWSFGGALVGCVFSLYLSAIAFREFAKCLDKEAKSKDGCGPDFFRRVRARQEKVRHPKWIRWLNLAGLVLFGLGGLFLMVFVTVNSNTRRIEAMPNEQSRGPVVNETRGMVPPVAPVARPATAVPLSDPGTSGVGSQRSPQSGASPMVVRIDPLPAAPAKPSTPAKPDDKR